ncbi:MAG: RNA polymerase sigma factor [Pirellulaceae bacterium]
MSSSKSNEIDSRHRRFATTSWSVVVKAGEDSSPEQHQALEALCKSYWYPLYAFLRKRHSRAEAEDITQSFFADLLEHRRLEVVDRERGRFRSFLLTALSNFRSNWVRHRNTQKRGGGRSIISIDFEGADRRFAVEPVDQITPERLFERSWAMTLLERAMSQLEHDYETSGKQEVFEELRVYLNDQSEVPYSKVAARLGMTTDAVRVAVHRLRKRCGDLVRQEIAQTVADPDQVDDELNDLFSVFDS